MNTRISAKIAAFAAALAMNCLIMIGAAHLFDARSHQGPGIVALAQSAAQPAHGASTAARRLG